MKHADVHTISLLGEPVIGLVFHSKSGLRSLNCELRAAAVHVEGLAFDEKCPVGLPRTAATVNQLASTAQRHSSVTFASMSASSRTRLEEWPLYCSEIRV